MALFNGVDKQALVLAAQVSMQWIPMPKDMARPVWEGRFSGKIQ